MNLKLHSIQRNIHYLCLPGSCKFCKNVCLLVGFCWGMNTNFEQLGRSRYVFYMYTRILYIYVYINIYI